MSNAPLLACECVVCPSHRGERDHLLAAGTALAAAVDRARAHALFQVGETGTVSGRPTALQWQRPRIDLDPSEWAEVVMAAQIWRTLWAERTP